MNQLLEELKKTQSIEDKVKGVYNKVVAPVESVDDILRLLSYTHGMHDLHSFVPLNIDSIIKEIKQAKNYLSTDNYHFV